MDIKEILIKENIPDKNYFYSTTSHKFKLDIWDFFSELKSSFPFPYRIVELGTSRGYTTKLLSYIFDEIYTINYPQEKEALIYFSNKDNINVYSFDLYNDMTKYYFNSIPPSQVYFIDAIHNYEAVMSDINLCCSHHDSDEKYLIFDDYGLEPTVKKAIDESISKNQLKFIKYIGQQEGWEYGPPTPTYNRILKNYEGIICKQI